MKDIPFYDFRCLYGEDWKNHGHIRYVTFRLALNWLHQNKGSVIVETGTARNPSWDDGMSTYVLGQYAKIYDGRLWTVDNDPNALSVSKVITEKLADVIVYTLSDSISFLSKFREKIDLLYLDSYDYDSGKPEECVRAQNHCLAEFQAAYPKLSSRAVVLIDDNSGHGGGKGELVKRLLPKNGFICLLDQYQSVWVRP